MASIRIHPSELAGELRARQNQGQRTVRRALFMAAVRGRALLVRRTPVDRGQAKNAWQVHKHPDGATLVNDAPYAGILELGARPHPVSREGYEAIYGWVLRHRTYFAATTTKSGRAKAAKGKGWQSRGRGGALTWEEDPVVAGIARAICANIKKHGQKPTYFVRDSIPQLTKIYSETIEREIAHQAKQRANRRGKK